MWQHRYSSVPRVLLVSASFGSGHDRAADQIAWRLEAAGLVVDRVDLINLMPAGPLMRWAYHTQLSVAPSTWDRVLALSAGRAGSRIALRLASAAAPRLESLVTKDTVAVISVYPLASQLLGELRFSGALRVPVLTFLTDMSVHKLWVAPGVDVHLALHQVAAGQAKALGARGVRVVGPLVSPAFAPPSSDTERLRARRQLGLPEEPRLALIVAGAWGVGDFERTARDIAASGAATPVIACAGNESARLRLIGSGTGIPLGWIDDMPSLLRASDVVVQNSPESATLDMSP